MRQISDALLDAQMGSSRLPYIQLIFVSKDGSSEYDYSVSGYQGNAGRVIGIEHHIEPFDSYATILLNNEDGAVPDLRGYRMVIFYGYDAHAYGGAYNECVPVSWLWATSQMNISSEGVKQVVLELKGRWYFLRQQICLLSTLAPYHYYDFTEEDTIFSMVTTLLNNAGSYLMPLEGDPADFDQAFIAFMPEYEINVAGNDLHYPANNYPTSYKTDGEILEELLNMTSTYLVEYFNAFKAVFPKDDDPVDETYYSYTTGEGIGFVEFVYRKNLTIPNNILVYCNYDFTNNWFNSPLLIGTAEDTASIDALALNDPYGGSRSRVTQVYVAGDVRNQTDASRRAQSILDRIKIASKGGRLISPIDLRVQLFDKVKVVDER